MHARAIQKARKIILATFLTEMPHANVTLTHDLIFCFEDEYRCPAADACPTPYGSHIRATRLLY